MERNIQLDFRTYRCRELFKRFDMDGSGTIQMWELKEALNALGQWPSDEVTSDDQSWLFNTEAGVNPQF